MCEPSCQLHIDQNGDYTDHVCTPYQPPEEFRYIPGFEGAYVISNYFEIHSLPRMVNGSHGSKRLIKGGVKSLHVNNRGYLAVNLHKENKLANNNDVHVYVAAAFLGPRPPGMEVCHNHGDRLNPYAWELRYNSRVNNHADKVAHGTAPIGENNPSAKYTEEQIREVKQLLETRSVKEVAELTGIHRNTVSSVNQGINWKHVKK